MEVWEDFFLIGAPNISNLSFPTIIMFLLKNFSDLCTQELVHIIADYFLLLLL